MNMNIHDAVEILQNQLERIESSILDTSDEYIGVNGEPITCLVDVIFDNSVQIKRMADAITPFTAVPGTDATGGGVASLTEAVMGVTSGLCQIAEAINRLAEAVEDH